jgi:hypothetical protein
VYLANLKIICSKLKTLLSDFVDNKTCLNKKANSELSGILKQGRGPDKTRILCMPKIHIYHDIYIMSNLNVCLFGTKTIVPKMYLISVRFSLCIMF